MKYQAITFNDSLDFTNKVGNYTDDGWSLNGWELNAGGCIVAVFEREAPTSRTGGTKENAAS